MGVRQLTLLKIYFEDRSNGGSFARLYYFLKPNFLVWSGRNFCYAPLRLRVGSRSLKGPSGRGTQIFAVEVQKIEQEEDEAGGVAGIRSELDHVERSDAVGAHAECLSWLFWQMGSTPYVGGGFGHFYAYAPVKIEYAIDRFTMETKRLLDVLDRRLAESKYVAGDAYTIADIAIFPWYGGLAKGWLYGAAEFLAVHEYKNVQRWAEMLLERPAVRRGRMVNRLSGEPSSQVHERHDAGDFDTKTQDKLAAAD